jgi:hypothetical protein
MVNPLFQLCIKGCGAGQDCGRAGPENHQMAIDVNAGAGYDRRLSVCSGKDNKAESAEVQGGTTI